MAEYTFLPFNKELLALNPTLGFKLNGKTFISSAYDFYPQGTSNYLGNIVFENDENLYYFNNMGFLYNDNGDFLAVLSIVSSTITQTTGTKIARVTDSDGTTNARPVSRAGISEAVTYDANETTTEEVFSIATLQPREEIAMHCLESMIGKYDNPLNIDNTKIKQLVSKSYLFAQEFINQAVLYREKETTSSTVESNKYASVDSDSLSSDTDKLLFNISTALTNWMAQNKNQYADQQKNGLKVNTADINVKTTFPDTINANVSGSINAAVSGTVKTQQDTTNSVE